MERIEALVLSSPKILLLSDGQAVPGLENEPFALAQWALMVVKKRHREEESSGRHIS